MIRCVIEKVNETARPLHAKTGRAHKVPSVAPTCQSFGGTTPHRPPQRRQAATRWQTNTTVCILCVGGSPKLGPATTLAVPSVGRGPRIGRIRHRTHPQRRQNSKICTADDGKPSTASSEIQNLSQHRRLPPPASPESQVSAQQRRLRTPHIRNRTSDHRI